MNQSRPKPLEIPRHWTPSQALAAFELIDAIREQLCNIYGPAIQRAYRDSLRDRPERDLNQLELQLFDEEPF